MKTAVKERGRKEEMAAEEEGGRKRERRRKKGKGKGVNIPPSVDRATVIF